MDAIDNIHAGAIETVLARDVLPVGSSDLNLTIAARERACGANIPESGTDLVTLGESVSKDSNRAQESLNLHIGRFEGVPKASIVSTRSVVAGNSGVRSGAQRVAMSTTYNLAHGDGRGARQVAFEDCLEDVESELRARTVVSEDADQGEVEREVEGWGLLCSGGVKAESVSVCCGPVYS